jgi:hypothetical protein
MMKKHVSSLVAALVLLGVCRAEAGLVRVGAGPNTATVVVNFADGADVAFEVAFDTPAPDGIELFDAIEAETALTTIRGDFGFGVFIDGISFEGHSNSGFAGGENWWHYWTRESAAEPWVSSAVGAADRVVPDGGWDGWVYGSGNPPILVPEPATGLLLSLAFVALGRMYS